jgi:hypothetical protein
MVTPGRVPWHLSMALQDTLNLFGADVRVAQPGPQAFFAWLHAPGIALAAAAFGLAVWRVPCRADLVSDVLAVGLVVNLAGFVASVIPATPFDARELAAALPYGAVLAGRVFGPWLTRERPNGTVAARADPAEPADQAGRSRGWRSRFRSGSRDWRSRFRPGVAALVLAGVCQLTALGYEVTRPAAAGPEQALAGWLVANHLTAGLGTYTEDNITTLDSGGAVRMLTVSWGPPPGAAQSQHSVARLYQSSASWYSLRAAYANFVVTGTADGSADQIPRAEILALAGPPVRIYRFESFTIMVWNKNLLALLAAPPSRGPGDIGHS